MPYCRKLHANCQSVIPAKYGYHQLKITVHVMVDWWVRYVVLGGGGGGGGGTSGKAMSCPLRGVNILSVV